MVDRFCFQIMNLHRKVSLMLMLTIVTLEIYRVNGAPQVPCYFVFGDSQCDIGNNNDAPGAAKANYKPYGIDLLATPTGRFTNGRNSVDFIAKFLGFDNSIASFKSAKGKQILKGVNYASGGSGILYESGTMLGEIASMDQQLKNHNHTISQLHSLLGNAKTATTHLKSCLYTVQTGSNDYLNNYYKPLFYNSSKQFTPRQYATALNKQMTQQLKALYEQGARKVAVFGVGPIGCTPYARDHLGTKGSPCADNVNSDIQLYNIGLKSVIQNLNTALTDAKFIFIDMFQLSAPDPSVSGQMVQDTPCCEVFSGDIQCAPYGKVCANRTRYIFWDGVHPTEVGFMLLASRAFHAQGPNDAYPYDISHLAQL